MTSPKTLVSLLLALAPLGCLPSAHTPGAYDPLADGDDPGDPLPDGTAALLTEADRAADHGPETPYLRRSLRAANRVLADEPGHEGAAWRAARALYFLSETVEDKKERAEMAARCMDVAQVALDGGTSAEAFYYAALCMGARARAKNLEAIELLPEMVEVGRRALEIDPDIVHGGPNRLLGGIYLRAPAWPTSVGDIDEALHHLEEAVTLAPGWAENHLLLAEALESDERYAEARTALDRAKALMTPEPMEPWAALWQRDVDKLEEKLAKPDAED